jgi:L-arabinose isomerase
MIELKTKEVWFITGSQELYGEETLNQVRDHSKKIVEGFNNSGTFSVTFVWKPVLTSSEQIKRTCMEANGAENCIGLVTWMHTFSPARMWLAGLSVLQKPLLHLHTQFNREIPWSEIDMDFMNLNQSAHGGREYGFAVSRLGIERKVVVGYWEDESVHRKLGVWLRAAAAHHDAQGAKIARFGDNMRQVAVTEGDKVEAQMVFGYEVNGYPIGDLVPYIRDVDGKQIDALIEEYRELYTMNKPLLSGGPQYERLVEAAKIEAGMRNFLREGDFKGFTTNFEELHGVNQLPGLAVQRLMAEGYGFGAEGDWKTSALLRAMKVMSAGLDGGTSFMEDYTYHFEKNNHLVLGAHMLEICPSVASEKPSVEAHPLSIGGKDDPVRLVFEAAPGPALNVTIIDLGHRFRMIVNEVEVVKAEQKLPKLPVARAVWKPKPDLETAAAAWILAGGAHHTGFSLALTTEYLEDFAAMNDIEFLVIDDTTGLRELKNTLHWNEAYYRLR